MAPKPDGLALIFGMVLAMAMVATWAAPLNPESESVAPIPPRETIYRPEHWRVSSTNSPRLPQDRAIVWTFFAWNGRWYDWLLSFVPPLGLASTTTCAGWLLGWF
jgi:hypothetical protein